MGYEFGQEVEFRTGTEWRPAKYVCERPGCDVHTMLFGGILIERTSEAVCPKIHTKYKVGDKLRFKCDGRPCEVVSIENGKYSLKWENCSASCHCWHDDELLAACEPARWLTILEDGNFEYESKEAAIKEAEKLARDHQGAEGEGPESVGLQIERSSSSRTSIVA